MSSVLKIRGRKDALHSLALLAIGLLLLMAPVGDAPNLQIKEARVVFLQNAPVILWLAVWWASVLLYLRLAFGRE
ncbi:MAG: hypothetical protein QGH70_10750, partial [Nitrospinota bacterium]|nr:hypothetical protein [Nitrospinota bacterium]